MRRIITTTGLLLSLAAIIFSPIHAAAQVTATSAQVGQISQSALRQISALEQAKAKRTPVQRKIDSQLLFAEQMSRQEPLADGVPSLVIDLDRDSAGRVVVDLKANVSESLLDEIKKANGKILSSFAQYQSIRAALPLAEIERLAARKDVLFVAPAVRAMCNVGSVTSEGDVAEKANVARQTFNVTGAGVKVGVLSDSVDSLANSQALGDLGTVTVLAGQAGTGEGEGTAMLEIVHDLAPGADLFFATGFGSPAGFADNIRGLKAAGCDIIIDDVIYFNEPPFQDGPISQAVNDVTAAGCIYFSSACNSGNKDSGASGVWEGDFADGGQVTSLIQGGGRVHSFGAANFDTATAGGSQPRVDFFWADPLGHSTNDYDVYVLDANGANIVSTSNNTQDGTQDPLEQIGTLAVGQQLVIVKFKGDARYLYLSTGRFRLAINTSGQTRGHACCVDAFGVAAVSAAGLTVPFTAANKVEDFSSDGLRRVFFNADGTAITPGNFSSTGGTVRQKPDIAAADGVHTTLPAGGGLNPFYGTSAAAPHAGAIAALLKSRNPGLTPAEVRSAMTAGVLDIHAPGYDRDSGFGLVMADRVLQAAAAPQPPTITSFTPASGSVGDSVAISGTKFLGATSVKFHGVSAVFTVDSTVKINATVPAGASAGPISVTTPDGTAASANNFAFSSAPVITDFLPASGDVGTLVTIEGANFTSTTNVTIGGKAAGSFTVVSSTQITATVAAGAATGKIVVSTPAGVAQGQGLFTITSTPVISGFSPANGGVGSSVAISGANFAGVNRVTFNGVQAVNPTVNSGGKITAIVPAGATTGPIQVTAAAGTAISATSFIVISPPAIASFNPASGQAGTVVTIVGSALSGATAVTFNGQNAPVYSVSSDTQILATAPAGVTSGPLRVTTPGGTAASVSSFAILAVPANDKFTASQTLSGNSGTVSGSNVGASKEPGEPDHAGNPGGKSVWYRWTAATAGTWKFDTIGSTFDTLLAVYTGPLVNSLTPIASNDDIFGKTRTNSTVAFAASPGTTYFIAVDGFSGGQGSTTPTASGAIVLNWSPTASVPVITSFSPASAPVGGAVILAGVNFAGATNVGFSGANASFTVNSATQITAIVPAGATAGPISVSTAGGTATTLATFTPASAVNNDLFANALVIAGVSGRTNTDNLTATKEAGEPAHAGNAGGKSVWFVWRAPGNGLWSFDTHGSDFDTLLAAYTGSSVNHLTAVASNDDWNGDPTSQLSFNAIAGTTYHIAVDGYGGDSGDVVLGWELSTGLPTISNFAPASGSIGGVVIIQGANLGGAIGVKFNGVGAQTFSNDSASQITATVPAGASTGPIVVTTSAGIAQSTDPFVVLGGAPPNDAFANRLALVGATQTLTGSNAGATKQAGEPNHAGNQGGSSVWWTWTAPSAGTYRISTRGSSFDTLLGLYTGSSLSSLVTVDSNDDGPGMGRASEVSFTATSGATYQIAVDGFDGAVGDIVLTVYPSVESQELFYTSFELGEGYSTFSPLAGQNGWQSDGVGNNGILYNAFYDFTQQAYVGYFSSSPGSDLFVWQPLGFTADANRPVVIFSTYMEIIDSSYYLYDDFGWDFYNRDGNRLFFLDFDNSNLNIYYQANDGSGYHNTGQTFNNDQIYFLEVTLDFARNVWSASLDDVQVVQNVPISATNNVALNLGDIDATWLQTSGSYGDNYMIFDDYYLTAEPSQLPRIITAPQSQAVALGATASFLVVVDSSLPVTYQWQFNGAALPGATGPTLVLNNVGSSQAGSYSVIVSNTAAQTVSSTATLTVNALVNLAPFRPAGWSDIIVADTVSGSHIDATTIHGDQDVYISWAVANTASAADITAQFYTQLYLDGTPNHSWSTAGLQGGFFAFVDNYKLGQLSVGTHSLRIVTDSTGVISESDETDNSYTKQIVVSSAGTVLPQLGSPSRAANGVFQFTLTGTPSRRYEILTSTNLATWSVLATLTNGSGGSVQFSDPTTNLGRRFYRGHQLGP